MLGPVLHCTGMYTTDRFDFPRGAPLFVVCLVCFFIGRWEVTDDVSIVEQLDLPASVNGLALSYFDTFEQSAPGGACAYILNALVVCTAVLSYVEEVRWDIFGWCYCGGT